MNKMFRLLQMLHLRYIQPILLYMAIRKYGNIEPLVKARFFNKFMKDNWKELKKNIFKK